MPPNLIWKSFREKEYDDINEHVLEQIKDRNSCIKTMDSQK